MRLRGQGKFHGPRGCGYNRDVYMPSPPPPPRLAQATGFLIPVSPLLLEMLHWAELQKTPKAAQGGSGAFTPDMALQLRAGSSVLRTPGFQEEVVTQVCGSVAIKCGGLREGSSVPDFPEEIEVWNVCLEGVSSSWCLLSLSREACPCRQTLLSSLSPVPESPP